MNFLKKISSTIKLIKSDDKIEKYFFKKQYLECISEANRQINVEVDRFFTHYYKGLSEIHLKFFEDAIKSFNKALSFEKKALHKKLIDKKYFNSARYRIAVVYFIQRDYKKAFEIATDNIETDPKYVDNHILRAEVFELQNKYLEALEMIDIGLKFSPNDSALKEWHNDLVFNYSVQKRAKRNE